MASEVASRVASGGGGLCVDAGFSDVAVGVDTSLLGVPARARRGSPAQVKQVPLDRAFRALSNGTGFVDFGCVAAEMQEAKSFFLNPNIILNTI